MSDYRDLFRDVMMEKLLRVMIDPDVDLQLTDVYHSMWSSTPDAVLPTKDEWNQKFNETISENQEIPIGKLRERRNELLESTDKYALPDYPHESEEVKQAWITYRQQLRDITSTITDDTVLEMDPDYFTVINFTWPTPPQ